MRPLGESFRRRGRRSEMPPRFQRPYPPEFRREAVRLVETSGRSIPQIAAELGVSGESLRNWLKQEQLDRGEREDGLTSDQQEELRGLHPPGSGRGRSA